MNTIYKPGQRVFFVNKPMYFRDKPDTEGIVDYAFIGEDGEERVIVKTHLPGENLDYRLLRFNAVADEMGGETGFNKRMKDPKYARQIAIDIGIYNEDGTLTIRYGGQYDLINGVKYYDDDCQ